MTSPAALQPLRGRAVLVTRPSRQSDRLSRLVRDAGGEAVLFPALAIEPLPDAGASLAALGGLTTFDYAIFISSNAVEMGAALVTGAWPETLLVVAVGEGTAGALRSKGFADVIVPQLGADTESVLALPQFGRPEGKRILIFRGQGGRELLAEALRKRGAEVAYVECYRRIRPLHDPSQLIARWEAGALHAVTAMSAETLDNLWAMLGARGQRLLLGTPLFVPHSSIAERAARLGLTEVAVTPPGDEGLARGLAAWFSLRAR